VWRKGRRRPQSASGNDPFAPWFPIKAKTG
jgi:hypothetical protein